MEKKQYKKGEKNPIVNYRRPGWLSRDEQERIGILTTPITPIHFTTKTLSVMKEALDAIIHFDREGNIKYRDVLLEVLRDEIDVFLKTQSPEDHENKKTP